MSDRHRWRDWATARAVGGVWVHLMGSGGPALCGFTPVGGWATPADADRHRGICRECIRFSEMERDGE